MAAGTKVIGRVAVRVMPDTSEFRRNAQRELDKIEKALNLKVQIKLDTKNLANELNKVKDQINRWRKGVSPVKVKVNLDLNGAQTQYVRDRLALLSRPRTVSFIPVLNEGAAARVSAALAALSGGRVLGDLLKNLKNIGTELDRWAPKIGAAGLALGGLASILLSSVSNMFALTLAVSQMAAAALALPALFSGAAIGALVLVVALTNMKKYVPEIYAQFAQLGDLIRSNFWNEARDGILALTKLYIPQLGETAKEIGSFFGTLASDIAEPFQKALPAMFENLNKAIQITTSQTGTFASIITTLGLTGSQYLPQMAAWINDLAVQFNTFLQNAQADGTLKQFIDAGIQGFKDLGNIIFDAGAIIGNIGKAAMLGGGSGLGMLAETMERIRAVVASPEFQVQMVAVFEAAHRVMSDIGRTAGPALTNFFSQLGEVFIKIGPAIGQGIGTALAAIANALASPAFTGGVVVIFDAINNAIQELAPALPAVANAFGALAPVVSALLGVIAPLVTAALIPLAKVIETLAPLFVPLIQLLGDTLLSAVTSLGPILQLLADCFVQIGTVLIEALAPLMPVLAQAFNDVLVAVMPLLPALTQLVLAIIVPLIPLLSDMIRTLLPAWVQVMQILQPIIVQLVTILTGLVTVIFSALIPWLTTLWQMFKNNILPVIMGFGELAGQATKLVYGAVSWLLGQIKPAVDTFVGFFDTMSKGVSIAFSAVATTLAVLPSRVGEIFSNAGSWLLGAGQKIIDGLIQGLKNGFNAVKETLGGLTNLLPDWKGPASKDATLLKGAGQLIIDGFIDGLESRYSAVRKSLQGLSGDISGMDMGTAANGIGKAVDGALNSTLGDGTPVKVFNYYAASGSSLGSEEDLFAAAGRARMVGW